MDVVRAFLDRSRYYLVREYPTKIQHCLDVLPAHALWRPKAREFIGALMRETDIRMLKEDLEHGVRLAKSLGVDVSDIQLPVELA